MTPATRPSKLALLYIIAACIILLGPFVGMLWNHPDPAVQTAELAPWPQPTTEDGAPNTTYLSQAGTWFNDHFAYRSEAITMHALLQTRLIGVSPVNRVIYGTNGWLYFEHTLDDYRGTNQPSARALYNSAHNLALTQAYVEAHGAVFAVTIAPNKNTAYPQYMPYWYLPAATPSYEPLVTALTAANVNYLDLFSLYDGTDPTLWFKRDTHWNNRGALLAYNHLLDALKVPHETYATVPFTEKVDHEGDIDVLLMPTAITPEANYYPNRTPSFSYVEGSSVEDSFIHTVNPQGSGTLLMYRDSFANALIPYFSEEFKDAYYGKSLPYDLEQVERLEASFVIIESSQRLTANFSANPPAFQGPRVTLSAAREARAVSTTTTLELKANGPYLMVKGVLDDAYATPQARIYVRVSDPVANTVTTYDAFYTTALAGDGTGATSDYGFVFYLRGLSEELPPVTVDVIIDDGTSQYEVATGSYDKE
ncbi:MAG: hypothetical protein LBS58_02775 [Coriobacteriales bacterium]|nr:hypothetical protein [Coriobacteriales bacterium]